MAVKSSAQGQIEYPENNESAGDQFAWFYDRQGAYMTSVLVYRDLLYRLKWNGNLACFDARSGEQLYRATVAPTSFIASPVASDGKIYMVAEDGDLYVAEAGREYKLLTKIPLGEVSLVTPGIAPGMLILRTAGRLIAVSES
jgi:outer membrane protein assembly factor BamB